MTTTTMKIVSESHNESWNDVDINLAMTLMTTGNNDATESDSTPTSLFHRDSSGMVTFTEKEAEALCLPLIKAAIERFGQFAERTRKTAEYEDCHLLFCTMEIDCFA